MRFSSRRTEYSGYEAVELADAVAGVVATFLPGLGMLGASLRHRGEEVLGRTDNLGRYASEGSTMGIPLLHPWANRLAETRYEVGGVAVDLDPGSPLLHLDGNGLPIHGVVGAALRWQVVDEGADSTGAEIVARLATRDELLSVFPFPHLLEQTIRLDGDGLTVRTALVAHGEAPVPVSFGYHPYVTLPGVSRDAWRVELPAMRRLLLDERSIPTGAAEPFAGLDGPLDRGYDDGFAALPAHPVFSLEGAGRRIEVAFLEGYPFAQVFAPEAADFICFEPMTAPTNALVSGAGLRVLEPGGRHTASFRIRVAQAPRRGSPARAR
jgi:galactose mutarotase-like enzyme